MPIWVQRGVARGQKGEEVLLEALLNRREPGAGLTFLPPAPRTTSSGAPCKGSGARLHDLRAARAEAGELPHSALEARGDGRHQPHRARARCALRELYNARSSVGADGVRAGQAREPAFACRKQNACGASTALRIGRLRPAAQATAHTRASTSPAVPWGLCTHSVPDAHQRVAPRISEQVATARGARA